MELEAEADEEEENVGLERVEGEAEWVDAAEVDGVQTEGEVEVAKRLG